MVATQPPQSLASATDAEANRHKYLESEKAGRDLGEVAIRDWVSRYWDKYLRQRWVEHLQGQVFWHELNHSDYGLLQRCFAEDDLAKHIIDLYKSGGNDGENLGIICRARLEGWPMDEVFRILEVLNINSRRLACQLEERLIIASSPC